MRSQGMFNEWDDDAVWNIPEPMRSYGKFWNIDPWDLLNRSMDEYQGPWRDKGQCMCMFGQLVIYISCMNLAWVGPQLTSAVVFITYSHKSYSHPTLQHLLPQVT